jgi:serine protease Do
MNPMIKPFAYTLLGAGVALVGSAGALDLPWFKSASDARATAAAPGATPTAIAAATAAIVANPSASGAGTIPPLPAGMAPNYRAIVQQFGPSVVGVTVEGTRKNGRGGDDEPPVAMPNDPFFRFFHGIPGYGQKPPSDTPFKGQGSGFIVSDDGLVLTNAHVVRDAREVTVRLADRREFSAKVLGTDTTTDIAVLRIDAKSLPTVHVGDPKSLMVGDYVLAIGAPFGLEQSATSGIVSAKGRSLPGDAVVPFIQTDAAVNPGNSGGPLFDAGGNVVGINSQIYSRTGGYQGLSFAIPIDVALKVKDQIVATGRAQHARLGVVVQDVTQALAESFGLDKPDGALVSQVAPKSAAAGAGLKAGDVILSVDGEPIVRAGTLSSRIGLARPGDKVTLKVWRDHAARDIELALGRAGDETAQGGDEPGSAPSTQGKLGLALRPLTREERGQAQLDHGMVIENVQGPAAKAGVEQGDVLLAINGKPVDSVDDVRKVLESKPKSVALLVMREGERIFVPVPLS